MEPTFADRLSTGPAFALCFLAYHLAAAAMGYGAALLLLPKDMKRDSLAFAPVLGFCVMAFGGWQLMFWGPPGTDRYWHWLLLGGVALTVAGCVVQRRRLRETLDRDVAWLALCAAVGVCFLASPVTRQPHLTTISHSNSDAAHYAAVERIAQGHRGDVPRGPEDQYNLGHMLRTAVTGAYLGTAALSSGLGVPLHQLQLPSVGVYQLWGAHLAGLFALRVLRFRRSGAMLVALVSGLASLTLFTGWSVFVAQFAAVALTLALFTVLAPAFAAEPPEGLLRRLPVAIALGLGLTLTYPHMVPLVWAALGAVGAAHALARRSLKRLGQAAALLAGAQAGMAALSPERVRTMVEYSVAMGTVEAGFHLPWVNPLTFLGLSSEGVFDEPPRSWWVMAPLVLGFAGLVGWGLRKTWRADRAAAITAAALLGTVGAGYLALCLAGSRTGVFGGYKAYKLLTFYYPLLLGSALLAFRELAPDLATWRARGALGLALALVAGVVMESAARVRGMRGTHFVVTPEMADLRRMERDPRVESINIVTWEWWSSMWETAFLLGKPLYQKAGSYYLKSERLEGQWTLKEIRGPPDDVLVQAPLDPAHVIEVNPSYTLVRSASLMELKFGTGWHGGEPGHRWTSEQRATVLVDAYAPRRAMLELTYTHLLPGTAFGVLLGDRQVGRCVEPELCSVGPLELPAGLSTLTLASSRPPELPGPGSPRVVGTAYRLIRFTPMEAN